MKFVHVVLDDSRLTKVPNSYIMCGIQTHQQLLKVAHLFTENCLIGQRETLPGIMCGGQKHPKSGGMCVSVVILVFVMISEPYRIGSIIKLNIMHSVIKRKQTIIYVQQCKHNNCAF